MARLLIGMALFYDMFMTVNWARAASSKTLWRHSLLMQAAGTSPPPPSLYCQITAPTNVKVVSPLKLLKYKREGIVFQYFRSADSTYWYWLALVAPLLLFFWIAELYAIDWAIGQCDLGSFKALESPGRWSFKSIAAALVSPAMSTDLS